MELPLNDFPSQFIETRTYILQTDNGFLSKIFSECLDVVFQKNRRIPLPTKYRKIPSTNFFVKGYPLEELRDFTYECKTRHMKFDNPFERDHFTVTDSYHKYVEDHKPFTAIIVGKPCCEISKAGRLLASRLNCFYVDPTTVLNNHMRQNSRIGKWIYANLFNWKKIPVDVLLKLLALELTRQKYQFYGYILGGLPVLPAFEVTADMIPPIFQEVPFIDVPKFRNRMDDVCSFQDLNEEGGLGDFRCMKMMSMSSSDIFDKLYKGIKDIAIEIEEEECEEEEEYEPDMDDEAYNEMVGNCEFVKNSFCCFVEDS